jgi:hypothetical protein
VTIAGLLGGHLVDAGAASVDAVALDAAGRELQTTTIGPVTPADRGGKTTLLSREASATLPKGTRAIDVRIHLHGSGGGYDYASADALALTLTAQEPPARPAVPAAPGKGATPAAAAPTAPASGKPAAPRLTVRILNARTALRDHRLRVSVSGAPATLRLALRTGSATAASKSTRLTAATSHRIVSIALGTRLRARLHRAGHTSMTLVITRPGTASLRRSVTFHR